MSRGKAGTKEGELAIMRWKETMLKKYGKKGLHKKMVEMGKLGGNAVHTKPRGFAASGLASKAGRIGGMVSCNKGYAQHPEIAGRKFKGQTLKTLKGVDYGY